MISEKIKNYAARFEEYLSGLIREESKEYSVVVEACRYSLLIGGKRLRPFLIREFYTLCGGQGDHTKNFEAAIEFIHTYSLIHDDLPCMDNDDYRRGRLTNHKVYGEDIAVLSGDALLTAAFSFLAKAPYSADIRIKAVDVLAECAGELGMVGGQILDMQSEERQCTHQEVVDIQSRKTGALIRAACILGVLGGEGSAEQICAAGEFADHLGLAFQIRDDVLDVIGDAEMLGKAIGVDGAKNTFVQLHGLDECNKLVAAHTAQAVDALSVFPEHSFMKELAIQLTTRLK